jgi:hypothetical protein
MMQRKRAREADHDLQIKVASGQSIGAKSFTVRTFSECAEQLPAGTQEWDVSGLLNNGSPFDLSTVQCWVNCAYAAQHGVAELGTDDIAQLSTAKGLHLVLSFAHAVLSVKPLYDAACSQLDTLKFVVQLPEQTLQPVMQAGALMFEQADPLQLVCSTLSGDDPVGDPLASEQQREQVWQDIAGQTGSLLHMAHVLHLQQLLDALHDFIFMSIRWGGSSLLYGILHLVITDEVLTTAFGSSTETYFSTLSKAYKNSVLTRPCSFSPGVVGCSCLLKPLDPPRSPTRFDAVLQKDFAGASAGDVVTVSLDLFAEGGGCMHLWQEDNEGEMTMPAQLLLGHYIADADDLEALMGQPADRI